MRINEYYRKPRPSKEGDNSKMSLSNGTDSARFCELTDVPYTVAIIEKYFLNEDVHLTICSFPLLLDPILILQY